mmetsp:Transcript_17397/g.43407  ORF Transcript_17397/g.43407 Transcript_17397/m.43407 type:complete len:446 (-) Transcript_17397:121-1458(-)
MTNEQRKMTRKMPLAMKVLLAMSGFYFCGMMVISSMRCFCALCGSEQLMGSNGYGGLRSAKHQALENFRTRKQPVTEVHVISLDKPGFEVFEQRNFDMFPGANEDDDDNTKQGSNNNNDNNSLEWFRGYDGKNQNVLDNFAKMTRLDTVNATLGQEKDDYASPHSIGCYLSHWRLLYEIQEKWEAKKKSQQKLNSTSSGKPDMLFIFEDDAHCVSNLVDRVWNVVQQLPKDWDILYIGGKPFSYYTMNETLKEMATRDFEEEGKRPNNGELLERTCRGDFGVSPTGPFAPGTTKEDSWEAVTGANLAEDPPYWHTKWVLNTHSYVINPKHISRVLRVLAEPMQNYQPVDVKLAYEYHREFMYAYRYENGLKAPDAPLKAYLTPRVYCDQEVHRMISDRSQPVGWEGFHWVPWKIFKGFPSRQGFVWGKIASRDVCSEFSKEKNKK